MRHARKGLTQIDWIISLSIFLTYLIWFFFFAIPAVRNAPDTSPLADKIQIAFLNNVSFSVNKIPIYVYSNISSNEEPIILSFPYTWNDTNYNLINRNNSIISEGRIMFLGNLNIGTNQFWLVNSNGNYTRESNLSDIDSSESATSITSQNFKAEFSNKLLSSAYFNNSIRLNSTAYFINGIPITQTSNTFNKSAIHAKYRVSTQIFNQSTYIFKGKTRLYNYISAEPQFFRDNITIAYTLVNYQGYYANNIYQNNFGNDSTCTNFSSDYVNIYNAADSMSVILSNTSTINLCTENSTAYLNITISISRNTSYRVFFNSGNYTLKDNLSHPYSTQIGLMENLTGISRSKMAEIAAKDYLELKREWSYPLSRDFRIFVTNSTYGTVFSYDFGNATTNIYSKRKAINIIDEYGNIDTAEILVNAW